METNNADLLRLSLINAFGAVRSAYRHHTNGTHLMYKRLCEGCVSCTKAKFYARDCGQTAKGDLADELSMQVMELLQILGRVTAGDELATMEVASKWARMAAWTIEKSADHAEVVGDGIYWDLWVSARG